MSLVLISGQMFCIHSYFHSEMIIYFGENIKFLLKINNALTFEAIFWQWVIHSMK